MVKNLILIKLILIKLILINRDLVQIGLSECSLYFVAKFLLKQHARLLITSLHLVYLLEKLVLLVKRAITRAHYPTFPVFIEKTYFVRITFQNQLAKSVFKISFQSQIPIITHKYQKIEKT